MTVDWASWLRMTTAEQDALWRRYRDIVKNESDSARLTSYRAMDAAIKRVAT